MNEPGGEKAGRYVLNRLARAGFVMVKTNKIDVCGRYVGRVFYSSKEKDRVKSSRTETT